MLTAHASSVFNDSFKPISINVSFGLFKFLSFDKNTDLIELLACTDDMGKENLHLITFVKTQRILPSIEQGSQFYFQVLTIIMLTSKACLYVFSMFVPSLSVIFLL